MDDLIVKNSVSVKPYVDGGGGGGGGRCWREKRMSTVKC